MNFTKQLIAAASLTVIGLSAFAQEATPDTWMRRRTGVEEPPGSGGRTRGRAQGRHDQRGPRQLRLRRPQPGTKTREQVRAELAEARASGEYDALNSEAYAFSNRSARTTTYAKSGSRNAQ